MLHKIDHVGIAVTDIEAAIKTYEGLGFTLKGRDRVDSQKVETAFFQIGESCIELIAATEADSPIAKFIEKQGEGIHHIAFEVDDIQSEMERLQAEGFELIHTEAKDGADNKKICFLQPKSTNGVLIELCQEKRP